MNLVLDDAEEISLKSKSRKKLGDFPFFTFLALVNRQSGRILLKGDNITLMMKAS